MKELVKNKEKQIVAFYIMYFGWLFTLTTLTVDVKLQNYFALAIVIFYFVFIRDFWDPLWFILFAFIGISNRLSATGSIFSFNFNLSRISEIPIWLPLSWGTTAVALKKFYKLVNQKIGN
ncbi:hypothetical protein JXA63_04290 [Candidatus Woesebacteria bacterium]|nr:hypothetical protein [Candidatus Woesebacteria bacterium]